MNKLVSGLAGFSLCLLAASVAVATPQDAKATAVLMSASLSGSVGAGVGLVKTAYSTNKPSPALDNSGGTSLLGARLSNTSDAPKAIEPPPNKALALLAGLALMAVIVVRRRPR